MNLDPESADGIGFIVGSEIPFETIIQAAGAAPLLKAITGAGAGFAGIADEKGRFLLTAGDVSLARDLSSADLAKGKADGPGYNLSVLYHEGEPVGFFVIASADLSVNLAALTGVVLKSLDIITRNTCKGLMAAELHTLNVERSYDELLLINHKLTVSEKKYRELAQTLEQKVRERTDELERAYSKLLQQEKMASIGQLAAGVAHEINNPTGFIYSNLNTFRKYIKNIQEMLLYYRKAASEVLNGASLKQAEELYETLRIDFITRDLPDLVQQSLDGAERIKKIVSNLKDFSHIDEAFDREMDLNLELDGILNILAHELREKGAEVVKKYGMIQGFYGNPGLMDQGFLNILLNALQARENGLIVTVTTGQDGKDIIVSISDNGKGIPNDIKHRIFEPFFTTREVGKGTGMGLTVAYDIITGYGGTIEVRSEQDRGAEFIIRLPSGHGGAL